MSKIINDDIIIIDSDLPKKEKPVSIFEEKSTIDLHSEPVIDAQKNNIVVYDDIVSVESSVPQPDIKEVKSENIFAEEIIETQQKCENLPNPELHECRPFKLKKKDTVSIMREFSKGKSFDFGIWEPLKQYRNDDFKLDFVAIDGVLLACKKNHTSLAKPTFKYDANGFLYGVDSDEWTFVFANQIVRGGTEGTIVQNVDRELSEYSENPVQNKVITKALHALAGNSEMQKYTMNEYLALKQLNKLENRFYSIYKNGELYRMYLCDTLIMKKAENGETITIGSAFPLVFPIIFA